MGSHSIPSAESRISSRLLLEVRTRLSTDDGTNKQLTPDAVLHGTDACCGMQEEPLSGRRYTLHSTVYRTVLHPDP